MTDHQTTREAAMWRRLARPARMLAFAAAWVATAACSPSDILDVQDPDIIPPEDVDSPAGANGLRVGALARFNEATSGGESLFLLGGLFADEWNNGDSFIARQEIDQRIITEANSFLLTANRNLHRARFSAEQAIAALQEWDPPTAPDWRVAEMYMIQGYVVNILAEHYCNGLVFSRVVDAEPEYGSPITTEEALDLALAKVDSGLAMTFGAGSDDQRVLNALRLTRGRILMNLEEYGAAAAAVVDVPTDFAYSMQHSSTTDENAVWNLNNLARRYSVSTNEGINGLDFATAGDPRVPVCLGGSPECEAIGVDEVERDDDTQPLYVQMLWPSRSDSVRIMMGVEARLIEAEAMLATNPTGAFQILNDARATVPGLGDLTDPGDPDARVDLLFRERAFWMFSSGHRVGDLRRLIRQYDRAQDAVFPVGAWHKLGNYGTDVTMPIPQAEQNNPNLPQGTSTCIDRNP